ncbi:MAG: MATE family efflux transporter [Crocinitomicaceae bacterium]|nr:MATE family efflux transporter [Crocinitomicaceae bacterium]
MLNISYKTILSVAVPLMASSFIQSIVLITDSSFLSRFSTEAYDAAGNGGLIYITLLMLIIGLNDGAQIIIARRIGEGKESVIPKVMGSAVLTNFIITIGLFLIMFLVVPYFLINGAKDIELAQEEVKYASIRSIGFIFSSVSLTLIAYFSARGKTRIILMGALFTALFNVLFDYLFIFGKLNLPAMGLKGAAIASVLSEGIGMIFFLILFKKYSPKIIYKIRVSKDSILNLLRIGSPIMLQGLIAMSTWTIFFFWIQQIGIYELTISQNIRSIYFLAFVPIWGFAATTKTYVSQYIGGEKSHELRIIIRRIQLLTVLFLIILFHGALLYPESLIKLINPTEEYIQESSSILQFIFTSVILYGLSSVYFQTISGSGNTRFTFYIELISVSLYILTAYLFIKVYKLEIFWIWSVEYIYFFTMGLFSILYLRFFDWKKKLI